EGRREGGCPVGLKGQGLEGRWPSSPPPLEGKEQNWLLRRKRDETARAAASRRWYKPMLATLAESLPPGDEWVYEVKWDGYRALGYVRAGEAKLYSRRGNDLNGRFPTIAKALEKAVRSPECVVDGEVCGLD